MENLSNQTPLRKTRAKITFSDEAKRLKVFRKHIDLTQQELAELLKVDQSMVFKYENGHTIIPFDIPKFLRKNYQMSYEWFYEGIGSMKSAPSKQSLVTDTKQLLGEIELLKNEVYKLKLTLKQVVRDFYNKD